MSVTGSIEAQTRDSLRLLVPGEAPFAVARTAIVQIDVSRGRHGNLGAGAGIGFLGGGVIGAIGGAACKDSFICPGPAGGGLVGALAGMCLGAMIGLVVRTERWERVDAAPPRLGIAAPHHGLGLGVSVRF